LRSAIYSRLARAAIRQGGRGPPDGLKLALLVFDRTIGYFLVRYATKPIQSSGSDPEAERGIPPDSYSGASLAELAAAVGLGKASLDRPGQQAIQMALFTSYGSNPPLYPKWQEYFRKHQPPTLIVWGKNDAIFPAAGATPYLRDLPNAELHLLITGHFALEEDGDIIARLIRTFLAQRVFVR
jgi:pimeloyl-ACP methyl ester carboxylesterase